MSSNCSYLHNEARLSILLIFERGKSKSALDKQLPPPSLPKPFPPTPNLCIFSLRAGFFQVFGLLRSSETPPNGCWVLPPPLAEAKEAFPGAGSEG